MTGYWFPICHACDQDARAVLVTETEWAWSCDQHRALAATALDRITAGWRPAPVTPAWRTVLHHLQGIRRPLFRTDVPDDVWGDYLAAGWAQDPTGTYATGGPAPVPTVHRTDRPPQLAPGHWSDGTPLPNEPDDEDWSDDHYRHE